MSAIPAPIERRAQGEFAAQSGEEEAPASVSVVIAHSTERRIQHRNLIGVDDPDRAEEAAAVPERGGHQAVRCVELLGSVRGVEERLPGTRQPGLALCLAQGQTQVTADKGIVLRRISARWSAREKYRTVSSGAKAAKAASPACRESRSPWSRWLVGWR